MYRRCGVSVGRHDVLIADQARQRATFIITRVKAGEDPVPLPPAARVNGGPTVADPVERYLEEHATVRLATAMCLVSGGAVADDYDLRGGIGLDRMGEAVFADTDCSSTVSAALSGCETGGDGAPYRSAGVFGTVPTVELGLG